MTVERSFSYWGFAPAYSPRLGGAARWGHRVYVLFILLVRSPHLIPRQLQDNHFRTPWQGRNAAKSGKRQGLRRFPTGGVRPVNGKHATTAARGLK